MPVLLWLLNTVENYIASKEGPRKIGVNDVTKGKSCFATLVSEWAYSPPWDLTMCWLCEAFCKCLDKRVEIGGKENNTPA